ncbi:MAG: hypothetical protein HKN13_08800, partial [Rhodothermales bacterium]|nr:hypothetical protein [Rhodothermales bacterium]
MKKSGFWKHAFWLITMVCLLQVIPATAEDDLAAWNAQIRRDKFDTVLPEIMAKHGIDMWIHVMREEVTDEFGSGEFGSDSGVFVFTDRGNGRIERAVLGRRWGARQRDRIPNDYVDPVRTLNAYD